MSEEMMYTTPNADTHEWPAQRDARVDAAIDNIIDRVNNLRKRIDDLEDLVRAQTP